MASPAVVHAGCRKPLVAQRLRGSGTLTGSRMVLCPPQPPHRVSLSKKKKKKKGGGLDVKRRGGRCCEAVCPGGCLLLEVMRSLEPTRTRIPRRASSPVWEIVEKRKVKQRKRPECAAHT